MEAFTKGATGFLPKLCEMVEEETEHTVVISSLDGITELLKHCKQGVTSLKNVPEIIVKSVTKIMKKECACQDSEEDEGMDEHDRESMQKEQQLEKARFQKADADSDSFLSFQEFLMFRHKAWPEVRGRNRMVAACPHADVVHARPVFGAFARSSTTS